MRARLSVIGMLATILAGCTAGPDFHRPAVPDATTYGPAAPSVGAQHVVEGMDVSGQWWTLFGDASLNALVADAVARNNDLAAAQAALRQARENLLAQRGAYLPSVSAGANVTRQDTADDVASALASNASLYTLRTAQVSVSYTADLWGATRRQVESVAAQAEAQRFQMEAAYLTLTTNVVNAVIGEAACREQIEATQRIVDAQEGMLDTLRRRHALGDASAADVAAQVVAVEQARAALPPLQKQLGQQRDLLAVLTGHRPDEALAVHVSLDALQLPATLPLSLPARLVEQRPDVRTAEEAWHGANADIGVAEAARLPDVQIDASLGGSAAESHALFGSGAGFWSLGAGITEPLFDGGGLRHRQRAAEAAADEAAAQYRGVVLTALQSVADTLHALRADGDAYDSALRAERAASDALDVARRQHALGDVSQAQWLAAELLWQQARLVLTQAQAARLSDTVALFQALGGGWWNRHDAVAAKETPR